jgi:hypothetical protein
LQNSVGKISREVYWKFHMETFHNQRHSYQHLGNNLLGHGTAQPNSAGMFAPVAAGFAP